MSSENHALWVKLKQGHVQMERERALTASRSPLKGLVKQVLPQERSSAMGNLEHKEGKAWQTAGTLDGYSFLRPSECAWGLKENYIIWWILCKHKAGGKKGVGNIGNCTGSNDA